LATAVSNFRPVAGLRPATVYRSDDPWRFPESSQVLLQQHSIRKICDLRSLRESRKRPAPLSPPAVHIPFEQPGEFEVLRCLFGRTGEHRFRELIRGFYHQIAFEQTQKIRQVAELLSSPDNLPALIHCNAGKDRTGLTAAILQLLNGVPYDVVRADYLRTNDQFRIRIDRFIKRLRVITLYQVPEQRMRVIAMAHAEYLDEVHARILKDYGSVEAYIGLNPATLDRLRTNLALQR
jgi:protein-tyrosine phosphatase